MKDVLFGASGGPLTASEIGVLLEDRPSFQDSGSLTRIEVAVMRRAPICTYCCVIWSLSSNSSELGVLKESINSAGSICPSCAHATGGQLWVYQPSNSPDQTSFQSRLWQRLQTALRYRPRRLRSGTTTARYRPAGGPWPKLGA